MGDLISVVIPVYNIKSYVEHCLLSVVNQTYGKLEIIIVDDGSSDGSSMICKSFAEKDSRIVYIRQDNKGLVAARKTGLIKATGKYVVFVDGDDYVDECLVEKLYQYIIQYDVDFVQSDITINGMSISNLRQYHYYTENDLDLDVRTDILKNHVFEWDLQCEILEHGVCACIYKKRFIVECYNEVPNYQQYGEDLICMCHQIMKCKSMIIIPESYYHYVMRGDSLTHNVNFEDSILNYISIYREVHKALSKYSVADDVLDKCHKFYIFHMLFCFERQDYANTKTVYTCNYLGKLFGKKVVIYGAGNVGKSVYEQLTNYENIQIVGWVDKNYKEIHCDYRDVCAPNIIQSLDYDYIVIAVENEDIAQQIKENLIESHVEKDDILWETYKKLGLGLVLNEKMRG